MGENEMESRKEGRAGPAGSHGFRIPPVAMVPVGLVVGWVVANWLGAVFGGVVGIFLWRSRA